jgi:ketosteroid isomerase-like protein
MLNLMMVAVLVTCFSGVAIAQKGPCTEQLIRDTNANHVGGALADDVYVVSPAHNGPVIGKTEVERVGKMAHSQRMNEIDGPNPPDHIVVAPSGDMACVYGTRHVSFDDKQTGKHVALNNAYLQVWEAVDGTCKIAATMTEREGQP